MQSIKKILSHRFYFAPVWVFASMNLLTGTWILYIPYIKNNFGLNDSEVGIALFFIAIGLLISFPLVPLLNKIAGIGKSTKWGIFIYSLAYNLPFLASTYFSLCFCLAIIGMFAGITSISMNALVSTIENKNSFKFMSAAHGFYSLGGFIGAGSGSLIMVFLTKPNYHMATISMFVCLSNLYLAKQYCDIIEEKKDTNRFNYNFKTIKSLLGLAFVAFIILLNEGAVENWSNLFIYDTFKTPQNIAGLGFIAFSLSMTLGRFLGDDISKKFGPIRVMYFGCLIAVIGYLFSFSNNLIITITGFGITGFGLSVIIPEVFRLSGNTDGIETSTGISTVSGIGFLGFLVGPLILGYISNLRNLFWSFGFLVSSVVIALIIIQYFLKNSIKER